MAQKKAKKSQTKRAAVQSTKSSSARQSAKQKKALQDMKTREHWMRWGIVTGLIVILLLLLIIGYITDWASGLRSNGTYPLSASLDSATVGSDGAGATGSNATNATNGGQGGTTTTTTNGGGGSTSNTDTTNNSTSSTYNSESQSSSTTTNNSTENNTTINNTEQPPSGLISIHSSAISGESINNLINLAGSLGVSVSCSDNLLVKNCTFTAGSYSVSTSSSIVDGIIGQVTKNF